MNTSTINILVLAVQTSNFVRSSWFEHCHLHVPPSGGATRGRPIGIRESSHESSTGQSQAANAETYGKLWIWVWNGTYWIWLLTTRLFCLRLVELNAKNVLNCYCYVPNWWLIERFLRHCIKFVIVFDVIFYYRPLKQRHK